MSVEFSIQNMMQVIADTIFGGSTELAGLVVMVAIFFVMLALFAAIKAPPTYAILPMMLVDVVFMYLGVMNTVVGVVIMIIAMVLVGRYASGAILGGEK